MCNVQYTFKRHWNVNIGGRLALTMKHTSVVVLIVLCLGV